MIQTTNQFFLIHQFCKMTGKTRAMLNFHGVGELDNIVIGQLESSHDDDDDDDEIASVQHG